MALPTQTNPFKSKPVSPVYDKGKLVGVEDPNTQQSRQPTLPEIIKYGGGGSSGGGGGGVQSSAAANQTSNQPVVQEVKPDANLIINQSGSVRIGSQTYYGNAVVPFSGGKTANQLRNEFNQQLIKSGIKNVGAYSGNVPIFNPTNLVSTRKGVTTFQEAYAKKLSAPQLYNPFKSENLVSTRQGVKTIEQSYSPENIYAEQKAQNFERFNKLNNVEKAKVVVEDLFNGAKLVPKVLFDYASSLGKGIVKVPLYAADNTGKITQIRFNTSTGKFYIPSGTKNISDNYGNIKKWSDYDYKTNPFKDPDYQNVLITTGFSLLGATSPAAAARIFGVVKGKAVWDAVNDPTPYNIAIAESMFLPSAIKKTKQLLGRNDILVANAGDLVPLKDRIKQIDYLIDNSGKKIESITSSPVKNVKLKVNNNKNNIDYSYGKKIEFATSKVGKAYPTSEYFLKGKAKGIQKLLKTGVVKIEDSVVSNLNKKYGSFIKENVLKKGRVSESFIKKYYSEAQVEANKLGVPVVVISPKRLRGFAQPEQEMIKIIPKGYVKPSLKFAGFTREGFRVYSDKPYSKSLGKYIVSKFTKGKIERSYFKEIVNEKNQYLKGRPSIRGEYAEHGKEHLTASNVDPYSKSYARKGNVKDFGNIFEKHDLAKVSDAENFKQFEHGKVLYDLWKKGDLPNDIKSSLKDIPKNLQKKIFEAYAGHTPVKPRLLDTLKKGWKDNSLVKDLNWYLKNKRNPILQDTLTLDRIELPRAGRWDYKVNYKLLDKKAIKRIYGSELNAIKNIRFLDWKNVPRILKKQLGVKYFKEIQGRDKKILSTLKRENKFKPSSMKIAEEKSFKILSAERISEKSLKANREIMNNNIKNRQIKFFNKNSLYKPNKKYKVDIKNKEKGYSSKYKSKEYKGNKKYKSSKYKSSSYKPNNYQTNVYKPSSYKTTAYKPTPYNTNIYKPSGYEPNGYNPSTYKPSGYKHSSYKTTAYKPTPYKPNNYTPNKPIITTTKKSGLFINKKVKVILRVKQKGKGYFVYARPLNGYKGQKQPKLVRVNKAPITLQKARDLRNYITDTSLSRTAELKQTSLKPRSLKLNVPVGYANRTTNKFRSYRIINKRRVPMINERVIEKNRNLLDTIQEKRRISLARRIAEINRANIPRRTINFAKREILLERLKKARAVRMRNLRRR